VKKNDKWYGYWVVIGISALLAGLTILLIFFYISFNNKLKITEDDVTYHKHYAMITEESSADLWQSIYKSAESEGKRTDAYVDMLSENFTNDYTTKELMEIAIASKVDGIILSANESDEITELINKAFEAGIPVVTVYSDNTHSDRLSFVGIGNYNLGNEYANLIVSAVDEGKYTGDEINVAILVDARAEDFGQNVLYAAIQDVIAKNNEANDGSHPPINVELVAVDATNNFSVEASVRSMFLNSSINLPDIVVCLNEISTTCVYQAAVDYNDVGLVTILGYYDSEAILKGISRDVIYATISIDTKEMGQYCVDALNEYYIFGNTSQYFSADISIINKGNVDRYMEDRKYEK